jgi:hypothetical protein
MATQALFESASTGLTITIDKAIAKIPDNIFFFILHLAYSLSFYKSLCTANLS